jgi:poly(A) polymerase
MPGTRTTGDEQVLQTIAAVLRERGIEGWLVGGTVRDRELGRYSPDLDVAVAGDAAGVARDAAKALGSPWFTLSEEHHAYRVVGKEGHIDLAAVRGGGILADLAQRDFTVNAMAMPFGAGGALGDLVDPFGGAADLRARRLVAVSDRIFSDDPLRLMRAARFSHVLGLALDPDLGPAVQAQAGDLSRAAPERVATEMILTLAAGRAGDAVRLWQGLGLLGEVFPELAQRAEPGDGEGPGARECSGDREVSGPDLALLDRLEWMLADPSDHFPDSALLLEQRLAQPVDGAVERRVALRLACLLRGLSPAQAQAAGRRLRLSSSLISLLETSARMRCHPHGPPALDGSARPGREAVLFLWAAAPWELEVILLAGAEADTSPAPQAAGLMKVWAERVRFGVPRLPFDGVTVMKELDLSPGPRLGKALRAARLAWEAGEAATAEQALAAAENALQ